MSAGAGKTQEISRLAGKKAIRSYARKLSEPETIKELNITPMMDMMTIILVFLLKQFASEGALPPGITLDPAAPGHLWIVDSGTDRVYQYDNAVSRTSGTQAASASFALASGNDAQGHEEYLERMRSNFRRVASIVRGVLAEPRPGTAPEMRENLENI